MPDGPLPGDPLDAARLVIAAAHAEDDPATLPRRLGDALCRALRMDGVSLSLLTDQPARQLLFVSDDLALELEELQFTLGEGPCITAAASGTPVIIADLHRNLTGWPVFGARARETLTDIGAIYALPLAFGSDTLGCADLLRRHPGDLSAEEVDRAMYAARAVALMLLSSWDALVEEGELRWGQENDVLGRYWGATHRASGVLAAQYRISVADALALMRAHAFGTGRPLTAITAEILTPPAPPGHGS